MTSTEFASPANTIMRRCPPAVIVCSAARSAAALTSCASAWSRIAPVASMATTELTGQSAGAPTAPGAAPAVAAQGESLPPQPASARASMAATSTANLIRQGVMRARAAPEVDKPECEW
jgi:hypothetical protein